VPQQRRGSAQGQGPRGQGVARWGPHGNRARDRHARATPRGHTGATREGRRWGKRLGVAPGWGREPGGQGPHVQGREEEREEELTTSTTNSGYRSPMIQERAGREWERGGRGRRGVFSLPRSWVRGRGEWWWFGRAWGEGRLGAR
jgi:hypothetical protein